MDERLAGTDKVVCPEVYIIDRQIVIDLNEMTGQRIRARYSLERCSRGSSG